MANDETITLPTLHDKTYNSVARRRIAGDHIMGERDKQDAKWGDQSGHPDLLWMAIAAEEFGEIAKSILEHRVADYEEVVQLAAVMHAWVEKFHA